MDQSTKLTLASTLLKKPVSILLAFTVVSSMMTTVIFVLRPETYKKTPLSSVVFSRENKILAVRIANDGQWRLPQSKTLPKKLEHAVLEFEDRRFYYHQGIDLLAIFRAAWSNVRSGKIKSGGSTITMQTIRLQRPSATRNLFTKLIEAAYAIKLDLRSSKRDILKRYLGSAPYGGNIVGASTASWFYFNRPLSTMSWAEAALLAVLPNSPSMLHLNRNRKALRLKRDKLLRRLNARGKIKDSNLLMALAESLPVKAIRPKNLASHLLNGASEIHSHLDFQIQRSVYDWVQSNHKTLKGRGIENSAVVVIDNETDKVVAYVGNTESGQGRFVDIANSARSSGSILKPLLYAGMLDAGEITPETLVYDIPSRYQGFVPKNFNRKYYGAVRAKAALAQSLNIPAVRMLQRFGIAKFLSLLRRSGISTISNHADYYGLSLIIGGAEVSLLQVTKVYSSMARKILGFPEPQLPLSRGAAFLAAEAISEVRRPTIDGFWKTFSSSQKIAWKTGTSHGFRDAWSIGFTPKYTVGVWVGNAYGQGHPELIGTKTAAPVMFGIFNNLEKSNWFSKPEIALKFVNVCLESGLLATPDCLATDVEIPIAARFQRLDNLHKVIHIDIPTGLRAHINCSERLKRKSIFQLPSVASYYFKRFHPEYRSIPDWKASCGNHSRVSRFDVTFPSAALQIIRTRGLDGEKSKIVLKAISTSEDETLFWHIDQKFIGTTRFPHDLEVDLNSGEHKLTVLDDGGDKIVRAFQVL